MLESLGIKNYRNLKNLRIDSLGKVNLITGKNNTGKSAILEAIAIYSSKGDLNLLYQLLDDRGENFRPSNTNKNLVETNLRSLSSLFTNRFVGFDMNDAVSIGSVENTLFGEIQSPEKSISLRFVKYTDEYERDKQGNIISRSRIYLNEEEINKGFANFKIGLEVREGDSSYTLPLDVERPYNRVSFKDLGSKENLQFIRTRNIDSITNGKLFDNIALTEKEQYAITALKIIEPSTDRIAFVEESSRNRTAVVKLSNMQEVLPLRSMGDGINRILTIILALVNADNGFLLIDEFENGLHYTVQEQLWNIIFKLAQELNVQVFATTHSEDCIAAFSRALNTPDQRLAGKLIRLDNVNGTIRQVEYNAEELKIATDQNIETR